MQDKSDDDEDSYMEDDDDLAAEIEGNKDAARALLRVKQKLDGYEGEMRSLEGQVRCRDAHHLKLGSEKL